MPRKNKSIPQGVTATSKRMEDLLPKKKHDTNTPLAMIIDGMGLVYAAYMSKGLGKLSFKGKNTSILFGVPQMIKSAMQRYKPEKVVVCWDGDRHPKRLQLLPEYKGHRDKKRDPEERKKFLKDVKRLRRLLFYMGIPQAHDKEVEGDDMVYFVNKRLSKIYRTLIVSGDKDFHQLINHDTSVFNPRTNEPFSTFAFKGVYPVEVPQFVDYLCLVGDKSDDIPGIDGIGPARAGKFFERFYTIKDYLKSKADYPGISDKDNLRAIYKRNRRLIDLKFFCERYYPENYTPKWYKEDELPSFNHEEYILMCQKYNLKTMVFPKFIDIFKK